jgi:DMSO reductase anchor subunit
MLSLFRIFGIVSFDVWISIAGITAICGLMGLFCMQRVYQLRSIQGWNSTRTLIEFSILPWDWVVC